MQKVFDKKDAQFTKAYSRNYAVVYGALYSRTGDPDSAEDMTQVVFIRFFNKMEESVNVRAWLKIILLIVWIIQLTRIFSQRTINIQNISSLHKKNKKTLSSLSKILHYK